MFPYTNPLNHESKIGSWFHDVYGRVWKDLKRGVPPFFGIFNRESDDKLVDGMPGTLCSRQSHFDQQLIKRNADLTKTNWIVKTYSSTDSANMSWDVIIRPIRL